uniref:Myomesin 3 n=1 Tax=Gasterosteus aculeatus aculeatus TaxID=481459 RepID=A0AAQ4S933_GASAC
MREEGRKDGVESFGGSAQRSWKGPERRKTPEHEVCFGSCGNESAASLYVWRVRLKLHISMDVLRETLAEEHHRDKWTMFGNEAEKVELDVMRNQRALRRRGDAAAFRKQAEAKASAHLKHLERLSQKAPDFPIPLRSHAVWEGMTVTFSCTVQGCPPPEVTWFKDGLPLRMSDQPWNYSLQQKYGLSSLEIRRCSPDDAGEYKAIATSPLGEALTFGTLLVNSRHGAAAGSERSPNPGKFHAKGPNKKWAPCISSSGLWNSSRCTHERGGVRG